MAKDLAKDEAAVEHCQYDYAVYSVVLGLADDAHLALRFSAGISERIPDQHSNFILQKDADPFPAPAECRSGELVSAFRFDLVDFASFRDDLRFALAAVAAFLSVRGKSLEVGHFLGHGIVVGKNCAHLSLSQPDPCPTMIGKTCETSEQWPPNGTLRRAPGERSPSHRPEVPAHCMGSHPLWSIARHRYVLPCRR